MYAYVSNMFRDLPTLIAKHMFVANYRNLMTHYVFSFWPCVARSNKIPVNLAVLGKKMKVSKDWRIGLH